MSEVAMFEGRSLKVAMSELAMYELAMYELAMSESRSV